MPTYPAILGQSDYCPTNPPATRSILTAAILAGTCFFVFAGDWAMPDQDAVHVMVSKYQIQTVDIIPVKKADLSQAIRASIFEYPWPAVDPSKGIVESGRDQWDESVAPRGLDKWSPTYPVQIPWTPPRALSAAIQAVGFTEVPPSQYPAKTWASNPWKTGLYPDDFTSRYQDNLPHWYPNLAGNLSPAIRAGSFTEVISPSTLAITKDQSRNVQSIIEVPDYQLRPGTGLSEAIRAGSFVFDNFGRGAAAYKDWALDSAKAGWQVEGPDIIPHFLVKRGLLEAIQAGSFWTAPYPPLDLNWQKFFIVERFWPDTQIQWMHIVKKTQTASILAGSFFEVPPVNAAKTWVQDMKNYGWQPEIPDITYNALKAGFNAAIQAGSFFYTQIGDHGNWLEDIDPSNWQPAYQDRVLGTPSMSPAIMSNLSAIILEPSTDAWATVGGGGGGLPSGTLLVSVENEQEFIYLKQSLILDI